MKNNTLQKMHETLRDSQLFQDIAKEDLDDLVYATKFTSCAAECIIIRQGEPAHEMYLIMEGSVNVRLQIAEQEDVTIGKLTKGETFGELALFDHRPRTATIVACEPCELLVVRREVFDEFLLLHPRVAIQLLGVMASRLRSIHTILRETLYADVTNRLAGTLRNIAKAYGKYTRGGLQIEAAFDENELGKIAGIPTDVVTAQLQHWKREGIISLSHGYLTLVNPDALTREERGQNKIN